MPRREPSTLFGSRQRTAVLILLRLLEQSYPSELTRLLDAKLYSIQAIVDALESEGILVSRAVGRTRQVTFNPRYVGHKELQDLLWKLGEQDVDLQKRAARKRGRPRRPGKPGL